MFQHLTFREQPCLLPRYLNYQWMKGSHDVRPVDLLSCASQCSFVLSVLNRPTASSRCCLLHPSKTLLACRIAWTSSWGSVNAPSSVLESSAITSGLGQSLPSTASIAILLQLHGQTSGMKRTTEAYRYGSRLYYQFDRLKCLCAAMTSSSFSFYLSDFNCVSY